MIVGINFSNTIREVIILKEPIDLIIDANVTLRNSNNEAKVNPLGTSFNAKIVNNSMNKFCHLTVKSVWASIVAEWEGIYILTHEVTSPIQLVALEIFHKISQAGVRSVSLKYRTCLSKI